MSTSDVTSTAPPIRPVPEYSPPYPWAETGVILFLVLALGGTFIRWLPGYLTRRENDARAARDAAWLAELKRDEDERILRDTLLSRHLNYSQTVLDDLLATQQSIAAIAKSQQEFVSVFNRVASQILRYQRLNLAALERIRLELEGLRGDVRGDVLFQSAPQPVQPTRPQGVGQSPEQAVYIENSGIDC